MLELQPEEIELVRTILDRHLANVAVWAFGSRVTGTHKPYSDLDLVVRTDAPLPMAKLAAMDEDFADSDLPFRVDVIDWASTPAAMRTRILQAHADIFELAGLTQQRTGVRNSDP